MRKSNLNIALLWHTFGHGNLGVDALARSSTILLRNAANRAGARANFVTLGSGQNYNAVDMPEDVKIGPAPRLKPLLTGKSPFLKTIRASDLVVDIGEGDSWTDIYGGKRFAFHCGTKVAALLLGKPLIFAPQTIGPFQNGLRRSIAAGVMNRSSQVFTRDDLSTRFLNELKVTVPSAEYVDVAFCLPFEPAAKSGDKIKIGLNVSGLLYNGGYTGKNELGMRLEYRQYTDRVIEAFNAIENVELHFFAHVSSSGGNDDDVPVARALATKHPGTVAAPGFATAAAAKSYMSGLDLVLAGRMHACIGAFSAGVPVIPVAYSRKFNGLFGTLGYQFFIDGKAMSTDIAVEKTLEWYGRRNELKQAVDAGTAIAKARLVAYEDKLVEILSSVANGD